MVKRVEHCSTTQCPLACSLDIIGDHWTLLIIREMLFMGLHEYKDLVTLAEGISSNILSDRLKKLEINQMIKSIPHPESKRRKLYYLTKQGKGLVYVILAIVNWADVNLSEKIHIPDDKRLLLNLPTEEFANLVLEELDKWEKQHL